MKSIGSYRLEAELGRGAMGVVFRGFDPALGRDVAIKVVNLSAFATETDLAESRLRFQREALAAAKLSHPNIVGIYDFGADDNKQYLVMEFVDGVSLDQMLRRSAPLPHDTTIGILSQIADALDYAHAQGVVHRDVKPANILLTSNGHAKLTDFGIARLCTQTVTQSGMTMGTPTYMAPEQIVSARVTGKADQFSLGVIAYEMLCNQKPFIAETTPALIHKIIYEEPPLAHILMPSVPVQASEVLRCAMAKDPAHRFSTCSEFVTLLAKALRASTLSELPPMIVATADSGKTWRPGLSIVIALTSVAVMVLLLLLSAPFINRRTSAVGQSQIPIGGTYPLFIVLWR